MHLHQIEILYIFVLNLREIHLFGKKVFFQQNLGPFSVMAAKTLILTVQFFGKNLVKGLTEMLWEQSKVSSYKFQ